MRFKTNKPKTKIQYTIEPGKNNAEYTKAELLRNPRFVARPKKGSGQTDEIGRAHV